ALGGTPSPGSTTSAAVGSPSPGPVPGDGVAEGVVNGVADGVADGVIDGVIGGGPASVDGPVRTSGRAAVGVARTDGSGPSGHSSSTSPAASAFVTVSTAST